MFSARWRVVACTVILLTGMSNTHSLTIMPLGDSITAGAWSWFTAGYRRPLYTLLTDSSYPFDFVGSQNGGNVPDSDHEGHGGWSSNLIRDNVTAWLQAAPAEIVLLHIGTNDIVGQEQEADEIVVEVSEILDNIYATTPNAIVIVARIINRQSPDDAVTEYNILLSDLVNGRIMDGDSLILVDMEPALIYPDDMYNDAHPNASGYMKMAPVWFDAIECVTSLNPVQPDTDNDGIGNACDADSDGDGLLDGIEMAGDINGDGQVNAADLVLGMRILTGGYSPSTQEQARFDVAPLSGGLPMPDGNINVGDYLILQRLVFGNISF